MEAKLKRQAKRLGYELVPHRTQGRITKSVQHDRVNHDRLLAAIAERVADKRMLKLIRAFLKAGVMEDGLVSPVDEGAPQGGPLSPLLSGSDASTNVVGGLLGNAGTTGSCISAVGCTKS